MFRELHMKKFVFIFLVIAWQSAQARLIWPDTVAPCNTTLQTCINAAAVSEIVEIRSNATLVGALTAVDPVGLVAGVGFKPVIEGEISITPVNPGNVRIEGLTLRNFGLRITSSLGSDMWVLIKNNDIDSGDEHTPVYIQNSGSGWLRADLFYNRLKANVDAPSGPFPDNIGVMLHSDGTGLMDSYLFNNTIEITGAAARGVYVFNESGGDSDTHIVANAIRVGADAGILINDQSSTGSIDAWVLSNAVYNDRPPFLNGGIRFVNRSATSTLIAINNSLINTVTGLELIESGGSLSAEVYNNLLSGNNQGFVFDAGVSISNDYNLTHDVGAHLGYTPGPNAINADPRFQGPMSARLRPDSPAIDAGSTALWSANAGSADLDADGTHRLKKAADTGSGDIDIGALEAGDWFALPVNGSVASNEMTLSDARLDGQPDRVNIQVTPNWNPAGRSFGVYNNANEAVRYAGGQWRIYNQNPAAQILPSAAFNLASMGTEVDTFKHVRNVGVASDYTILNHLSLNLNSGRILSVTPHNTAGGGPDSPIGVEFRGPTSWAIVNMDGTNMPDGTAFNVYVQHASLNAWVHTAGGSNLLFNYTLLDHPLLNGNACAQVLATAVNDASLVGGHSIGVWYDESVERWSIFNQDLATMQSGRRFHVVINPAQAETCGPIFADGFE